MERRVSGNFKVSIKLYAPSTRNLEALNKREVSLFEVTLQILCGRWRRVKNDAVVGYTKLYPPHPMPMSVFPLRSEGSTTSPFTRHPTTET